MEVSGQLHTPVALPLGRALGTHLTRGWAGPRAGLDAVARIENLVIAPVGKLTPVKPVA